MKRKIVTTLIIILLSALSISKFNAQSSSLISQQNSMITDKNLSEWWWEPIELLTPEFDEDQGIESMAIDEDNNIHLLTYCLTDILSSGSDRDVFYKKYNYATNSWSALELVSTESTDSSEISQIDIDSTGVVHAIWVDSTDILGANTDPDIFYKQRTSSGWSTTELVSVDSDGNALYPRMKIDSNNVLHVVWHDSTDYLGSGTDYDIHYIRRASNGVWSTTEVVSELCTANSDDVDLTVDNHDNVHIVWSDYTNILGAGTGKDIFYRMLDSDLTTWSSLKLISTETTSSGFYPTITSDIAGNLIVTWSDNTDLDGSGTDYDMCYKYYSSSSFSWSTTEVISIESSSDSYRASVWTDLTDYIYIAYVDDTDLGEPMNENIFFKYLDLEAMTWSSYSVITHELEGPSDYPFVIGDSHGHIYLTWIDSTPDLLSSGLDSDYFWRKFVGVPQETILNELIPNTLPIGNVSLSWSSVRDATNYEIYREIEQFTSVSGLTAIDTTSETTYTDELNSTGNYYYAIVSVNDYGKSSISNIVYIEIVEDETLTTGLFSSLNIGELLIIGGIVLVLQLIFSLLTYSLISSKVQSSSKPKRGKK